MAVSIKRLEGTEIPDSMQEQDVDAVFEVRDSDGRKHIATSDVEAAALAVEFSEEEQRGDS